MQSAFRKYNQVTILIMTSNLFFNVIAGQGHSFFLVIALLTVQNNYLVDDGCG